MGRRLDVIHLRADCARIGVITIPTLTLKRSIPMRRKPVPGARAKVIIDVPAELDVILKRHREIPWARVAEQALWRYARQVALADRLASRSALTETAARDLARSVKAGLRRRYAKTASA